jgi:N-acetyl sugar amidotransferase
MDKAHPLNDSNTKNLQLLIEKIKEKGENKKYDCVVGVSGGRDSTYTLYTAVKLGLRPLAVHFDNGWNSDISVTNIKRACDKLGVELITIVADWQEFKDLQLAFLRASVPDADIPTDYAIYSTLYYVASKEGIKYILNGHSFRTEGTSPISWTYMDPLYVKDVLKKHSKRKSIKSFPHMTILKLLYYIFIKHIREIRILEYINYIKKDVDEILKKELDWQYYGGHHHENVYTKFFQSYILPVKFNIDKRKTELSAMIRSGQITRDEALSEINNNAYRCDNETVNYALNKLELSEDEFKEIMGMPPKKCTDYKTLLPLIKLLKLPIRIACSLHLLPRIFYLKYAK